MGNVNNNKDTRKIDLSENTINIQENVIREEKGKVENRGWYEKIRDFFSKPEWYFYFAIIIISLCFRWIGLEDRPIHHDESLHLIQGFYYFERPETGYYKYDPMLHGPFLYYTLRYVYEILGYSLFAGRAYMAFLGTIFLFLPLFFRKYLKPRAVLFMTMLIGFSPSAIFWSRFLRSDMLMLSWWAMILCGVVLASPKWKSFFVMLGLGLQICTKENSYVFYAMMVGYLAFEYFIYFICKYDLNETMVRRIWKNFLSYKSMYGFSLFITCLVIYYFFSGGFRYYSASPSLFENAFGTFLDGIYRKSIGYWAMHHGMERIKGPFNFQFYMLAWHDFMLLICMVAHIIYLCVKRWWASCAFGIALVIAFSFASVNGEANTLQNAWIWKFFKLKNSYDFFGLFLLPTYAVVATMYHLLNKQRGLAFFAFFAGGNLATYCYLGEKVPWLSIYPIMAFMIYYSLLFNEILISPLYDKFKKLSLGNLILVIGGLLIALGLEFMAETGFNDVHSNTCYIYVGLFILSFYFLLKNIKINVLSFIVLLFVVYDLRMARIVNFQNAGSEFEVMSQVHTTKEFHNILEGMKQTMRDGSLGYDPLLYVSGESNWPTVTYFIGYPEIKYGLDGLKVSDFKYIIEDQESTRKEHNQQSVIAGFENDFNSREIKTRCWYDPNYAGMNFKAFLNYALNHKTWSGEGFFHATLHVRKY